MIGWIQNRDSLCREIPWSIVIRAKLCWSMTMAGALEPQSVVNISFCRTMTASKMLL
jgi:hypothetical protein